jgi:hypothetical protein
MEIKTIRIELEPDKDSPNHATLLEYKDGMWTANGPVWPRINMATMEIYRLLKGKSLA